MKSLWNEAAARALKGDLLKLRVYTSRLLGQDEDLVMHGGGNTSVKIKEKNIFGQEEEILYVKGSGWDLGTIEAQGFAPVKLSVLHQLAQLDELSDLDMVKYQRMAMTNPSAPNPSVEAILHAIIPFTFVDHSHADAVVTITNSPGGRDRIAELYGPNMLIVPYVMPGFILAKAIYEQTKAIDWSQLEGMILMNHGVFTFDHNAKASYEKMIDIVDKAEQYLAEQGASSIPEGQPEPFAPLRIAQIRRSLTGIQGQAVLARLDDSPASAAFSQLPNMAQISQRGPLTPDHIIRTKRIPVILGEDPAADFTRYVQEYKNYFETHNSGETQLDPAPRWAILPGTGSLSFGPTAKHLRIIEDISQHTRKAIYQAEQLGAWIALPQSDLFEMEYWNLEQAKLKKAGKAKVFQGQIALVSGAASGIGKACVERLVEAGAVVVALDIDPGIKACFSQKEVLGIQCDISDTAAVEAAVEETVKTFGGLDMLISNAGIFPPSTRIEDMDPALWDKSMLLNVSSHQRLLQLATPYLSLGVNPSVVFVGSKNVPAPGPGAAAYSVAKAGLTQLCRVAAMELGEKGIRVNIIHPNAVFDTGIWTETVLQTRAKHYGLSVEEYKTNNILKKEVRSRDVADLTLTMLGPVFAKTTGAQVPIDGGNERVI